jgi:heme-degrading monooxygenase HmoA
MYGTVAKIRVKPGMEEKLKEFSQQQESARSIPGWKQTLVYRTDNDPQEYLLVVAFESKESYTANAESPDQDAEYRKFRDLLERDPEWQDGEIIYSNGA